MSNLKKNLIAEGVLSAELPDTSGEILSVAGADISDLQTGRAPCNTEHQNPEDIQKDSEGNGFQSIVGRVITAKKIYGEEDCSTPDELRAYKDLNVPLIWGKVEIFDGPSAHDNSRALASVIRNYDDAGIKQLIGYSVEGNTLKREGNILKSTVIKRLAITAKPANKAAVVQVVKDLPQSSSNSMNKNIGTSSGYEPLYKSENFMQRMRVVEGDFGLAQATARLRKALDAGGANAAPGSLTQGSSLQRESQLSKLKRLIGNKRINRDTLKRHLPNASDEDLDKVEAVLKHQHHQENVDVAKAMLDLIEDKNKVH
jgi:hypothetical protein